MAGSPLGYDKLLGIRSHAGSKDRNAFLPVVSEQILSVLLDKSPLAAAYFGPTIPSEKIPMIANEWLGNERATLLIRP